MEKERAEKTIGILVEAVKKLRLTGYIVGGYPRAEIAGGKVRDIDVLILESEKLEELLRVLQRVHRFPPPIRYQTGKGFERILFKIEDLEIEIIPSKFKTLKTDLLHRDFTINTLVIPLKEKSLKILDPLGSGKPDLSMKIIRTPRSPEKTLREDPIRIIRAVRFASEISCSIEENLWEEMKKLSHLLQQEPGERIGEEMLKIFELSDPSSSLFMLRECGVMEKIIPEIVPALYKEQKTPYHTEDIFSHSLRTLSLLKGKSTALKIAAFFHDFGKAFTEKFEKGKWVYYGHQKVSAEICEKVLTRWGVPKEIRDKAIFIIKEHMIIYTASWTDSAIRRLIYKLGDHLWETLDHLIADIKSTKGSLDYEKRLALAEELLRRVKDEVIKMKTTKIKPLLDGFEIQEILGIPPSPLVGKAKDFIINNMIANRIKTKEEAISLLLNEFAPKYIHK
jgi:putative nucleotidyltransferase with HDIG domain